MREKMKVQDYINRVVMPIEDEITKLETAWEIKAHIDERIEFYKEIGYDDETAEKKAVEDMGDPEPVGASLSRLHPKGRVITAVLAALPLVLIGFFTGLILLFTADERRIGARFITETLWLVGLLGLSHMGKRRNCQTLCTISVLLFCALGVWQIIFSFGSGFTSVYSPHVLIAACLLTGDMECLRIFPLVGGVTFAPWLTALSVTFYVLLFALLLAAAFSVARMQKTNYRLRDKKANKRIGMVQRSAQVLLAFCMMAALILPYTQSTRREEPLAGIQYAHFNTIIIAQSDTPCRAENVEPQDFLIFESAYYYSPYYVASWDAADYIYPSREIAVKSQDSQRIITPCGNNLQYELCVATLTCEITKPYVYIAFASLQNSALIDDGIYANVTIEPSDWQPTESIGTVDAIVDYYNRVEVVVNDARE